MSVSFDGRTQKDALVSYVSIKQFAKFFREFSVGGHIRKHETTLADLVKIAGTASSIFLCIRGWFFFVRLFRNRRWGLVLLGFYIAANANS